MISILALIIFLVLAILLFIYNEKGFFLLFFFRPVIELSRIEGITIFGFSIAEIIGIIIPVIFIILLLFKYPSNIKIQPILLIFIVLAILTQLFHGIKNVNNLIRVISPILFFLYPQTIKWSDDNILKFIRSICYSLPFVFIAIIISYNAPPLVLAELDIGGDFIPRWGGFFYVPTRMAYWLSIFFVTGIFYFIIEKKSKLSYLYLMFVILLLVPIYWTFSRTAWVSCLICILLMFLMIRKYWIAVVITLTAILINIFFIGVGERMASDPEGLGRLLLWIPVISMFADLSILNKLFGVGWANIMDRLVRYLPFNYPIEGVGTTENMYLYLLLGGGLVILIVFILFIVFLLRSLWKLSRKGSTRISRNFGMFAFSVVIMMIIQGLTDDLIISPVMNWYYYAIAGTAISAWIQENVKLPEYIRIGKTNII
jgi:hypothetical protein